MLASTGPGESVWPVRAQGPAGHAAPVNEHAPAGIHRGMTLQALFFLIGTILAFVAVFVPAVGARSYSVLAAGVGFLGAGFVAGAI